MKRGKERDFWVFLIVILFIFSVIGYSEFDDYLVGKVVENNVESGEKEIDILMGDVARLSNDMLSYVTIRAKNINVDEVESIYSIINGKKEEIKDYHSYQHNGRSSFELFPFEDFFNKKGWYDFEVIIITKNKEEIIFKKRFYVDGENPNVRDISIISKGNYNLISMVVFDDYEVYSYVYGAELKSDGTKNINIIKELEVFNSKGNVKEFKFKISRDVDLKKIVFSVYDVAGNLREVDFEGNSAEDLREWHEPLALQNIDFESKTKKRGSKDPNCFMYGVDYLIVPYLVNGSVPLGDPWDNFGEYDGQGILQGAVDALNKANTEEGYCGIELFEPLERKISIQVDYNDMPDFFYASSFPFIIDPFTNETITKWYLTLNGAGSDFRDWLNEKLSGYTPDYTKFTLVLVDMMGGNVLGFAAYCDDHSDWDCGWIALNMESNMRDYAIIHNETEHLEHLRKKKKLILAHEMGHGWGLGHNKLNDRLMYENYAGNYKLKEQACPFTANGWGNVPANRLILDPVVFPVIGNGYECKNNVHNVHSLSHMEYCEEETFSYPMGGNLYCSDCAKPRPSVANIPGEELYCDLEGVVGDPCGCYEILNLTGCNTSLPPTCDAMCPNEEVCVSVTNEFCMCSLCGNGQIDNGEECETNEHCEVKYGEGVECILTDKAHPENACVCDVKNKGSGGDTGGGGLKNKFCGKHPWVEPERGEECEPPNSKIICECTGYGDCKDNFYEGNCDSLCHEECDAPTITGDFCRVSKGTKDNEDCPPDTEKNYYVCAPLNHNNPCSYDCGVCILIGRDNPPPPQR